MPPADDECEQAKQAFQAGNASKQASDLESALAHYSAGLQTARTIELRSALYVNRGLTLFALSRYDEALLDGKECAKIRPSWAKTYELQATAMRGLGYVEEADVTMRLGTALGALKKDPKNEENKRLVKSIRAEIKAMKSTPADAGGQQVAGEGPKSTVQDQTATPATMHATHTPHGEMARGSLAEAHNLPRTDSETLLPTAIPPPMPSTEITQKDSNPSPAEEAPADSDDTAKSATTLALDSGAPAIEAEGYKDEAAHSGSLQASDSQVRHPSEDSHAAPTGVDEDQKDARAQEANNSIMRGGELHRDGDLEGAIEHYKNALKFCDDVEQLSAIHFNLSIAYSRLRQFESGLEHANLCIKHNPAWPLGLESKGAALEGLGKFSEAMEAFEAALDLDPENETLKGTMRDLGRKLEETDKSSHQTRQVQIATLSPFDYEMAGQDSSVHEQPQKVSAEASPHVQRPDKLPGTDSDKWWKDWKKRSGMSPKGKVSANDASPVTDSPSEQERIRVREQVKARRRDGSLNSSGIQEGTSLDSQTGTKSDPSLGKVLVSQHVTFSSADIPPAPVHTPPHAHSSVDGEGDEVQTETQQAYLHTNGVASPNLQNSAFQRASPKQHEDASRAASVQLTSHTRHDIILATSSPKVAEVDEQNLPATVRALPFTDTQPVLPPPGHQGAPGGSNTGSLWAAQSLQMQEQYRQLRAREEALLGYNASGGLLGLSIGDADGGVGPLEDLLIRDPHALKLTQQQQQIREKSAHIQELDKVVRASAHTSGHDLRDEICKAKDEIVALEQLAASQAVEHRIHLSKLLSALNRLDAQDKGIQDARRGAGSRKDARREAGSNGSEGVTKERLGEDKDRTFDKTWAVSQSSILVQENQVETRKVVTMSKEISRLEQEALELRTKYLDKEQNGRKMLETLHDAIRDKELEIERLEGELRTANTSLVFVKNRIMTSQQVTDRRMYECKTEELQAHMQYMQAIKSIQELRNEVSEEQARVHGINEKLAVVDKALKHAIENTQLMVQCFEDSDHVASNVSSSARASVEHVVSSIHARVPARASYQAHDAPASPISNTQASSSTANDMHLSTISPVGTTSHYRQPQLSSSGADFTDSYRWPGVDVASSRKHEPQESSSKSEVHVWI